MFAGIATWILGTGLKWLSGGLLTKITDFLRLQNDNKARVTIAAIQGETAARMAAMNIRIATAGFAEMRIMTTLIALPFVVHLWLVFMDTAFGTFRDHCWQQAGRVACGIPAFPAPFNEWEGLILLSFFGVQAGLGILQSAVAVYLRGGK